MSARCIQVCWALDDAGLNPCRQQRANKVNSACSRDSFGPTLGGLQLCRPSQARSSPQTNHGSHRGMLHNCLGENGRGATETPSPCKPSRGQPVHGRSLRCGHFGIALRYAAAHRLPTPAPIIMLSASTATCGRQACISDALDAVPAPTVWGELWRRLRQR